MRQVVKPHSGAIEALGATYEGTWRNHRILSDGHRRDSAYYSVIDVEWPAVRQRLAQALAAPEP